jgi:hypothetical protein
MARSIDRIAARARALYAKAGLDEYRIWAEDGWREFVHECGGFYTQTLEVPLIPGTWQYALPSDWLKAKAYGVYLYYAERTISAITRTSNVVAVTTTAAHKLTVGVEVVIAGVTGVGGTTFNGTFTVVSVPATVQFTYAQTATNDTGTGGTVNSQDEDEQFLSIADDDQVTGIEGWRTESATPTDYFFPDPLNIALSPVPDGADPVMVLRYDAEVADDLDTSVALPGPSWVENAIVGYCHREAALVAGDAARMAAGAAAYEVGKNRWRGAQVDRTLLESEAALASNERQNDIADDDV